MTIRLGYKWGLLYSAGVTGQCVKEVESRECDHCHWDFPELLMVPVEGTGETYCFGCYHCWKVGAPRQEEVEA